MMDQKRWAFVALALAALAVPSAVALGDEAPAPAAVASDSPSPAAEPPAAPAPDELEKCKTPCPWLTMNGDLRFREIFAPNMFLDKEDRHWQSYRGRIGASVKPCDDLSFNFQMVYEPMHYFAPHREMFVDHAGVLDNWVQNEAIFDTFNIQWSNIGKLPVTVTVGRQALIFGNGWLVLDGTPYDQSRTIFFDAVRTTFEFKPCQTTLDVVYINNRGGADEHSPVFGQPEFPNAEQDEQGVIVYASNKSIKGLQVDSYFIYKHDERVLGLAQGTAPWQQGTNGDIYAVGNRFAAQPCDRVSMLAEYAYEWGNKNGQDINALGFNSQIAYHLLDKCKSNVHWNYEYLSGDHPSTEGVNEQFDPLWGRWARWSELYANQAALENRPGEMTNLHRFGPGFTTNPCEKVQVDFDYHVVYAATNSARDLPYFTRSGHLRGQALVGNVSYQMTKHIAHSFRAEVFFPGDYYNDSSNEVAGYFRYELTFTW